MNSARISIVRRVCVALAVSLFVARSSPAQSPQDLFTNSRTALYAHDWTTAKRGFEELSQSADVRLAARAQFMLGEIAEHEYRFQDALGFYRSSVSTDSGGSYAGRALARSNYLSTHSEGDFVPLVALEQIRSDATRASDPVAIANLARSLHTFPPGLVRAESLFLVSQAYSGRLHRPRDAAPVLRELALDFGANPDMRAAAIELLARSREETGDYDIGLHELIELHAPEPLIVRLRAQVRRQILHKVSIALSTLVLLMGLLSVVIAVRKKRIRELIRVWLRPLPIAHLAMLSLGGAFLAHSQEQHSMTPFLAFGAGALIIYLSASAWSLVGRSGALFRISRATICAVALLAVSFLAMYQFDAEMLTGIGL